MLGGGLKWKAGRLADLRGNKNNNLLSITCTSLPSILTRHVGHVYFQIVKVYAKHIYNVFDT